MISWFIKTSVCIYNIDFIQYQIGSKYIFYSEAFVALGQVRCSQVSLPVVIPESSSCE